MLTVGITGQIGCGKSTVAKELARLGAVIIDADGIGKSVVESDRKVVNKLMRAFGNDIVDKNGKLNRRKLATRAFASEVAATKLNSIVHPSLLTQLRSQIKAAHKLKGKRLVIVDAALIYNWRLDKELDLVVVVESTRNRQVRRLRDSGLSDPEIFQRIRRQIPKYRLRRMADAVIRNNGSKDELVHKTWRLFARLVQHSGQKFD